MGRKYYGSRKHHHRGGSGNLVGMLLSALAGGRSHGYHRPRSSLKNRLVGAVVKAILKKIFR
jgi:hypothetical protein